eukprot:SAG31_NODE_42861_length_269_cov_1.505882_2_plen_33_part_01
MLSTTFRQLRNVNTDQRLIRATDYTIPSELEGA